MSRHLLLDRPDRQIVLGYDHMLQSFFGQVFVPNHPRRAGIAVDGWPTKSGLGRRRPCTTEVRATEDLLRLQLWAASRLIDEELLGENARLANDHLFHLEAMLRQEQEGAADVPEVPLPNCLKGPRP